MYQYSLERTGIYIYVYSAPFRTPFWPFQLIKEEELLLKQIDCADQNEQLNNLIFNLSIKIKYKKTYQIYIDI